VLRQVERLRPPRCLGTPHDAVPHATRRPVSTVAQGEPPWVTHVEPVRRRDRTLRIEVSSCPCGGGWRSASGCVRLGNLPR
jgi:hypothetical protein